MEKHIYWLDESNFLKLKHLLSQKGITPFHSKKAICSPLSKRVTIGFVTPIDFKENPICKRQLSWYMVSRYKDKYLVISSKEINDIVKFKKKPLVHILFKESNFIPKKLPNNEEIKKLINQKSYQSLKPKEWEEIDIDEKFQKRWMKIIGLRKMTFSDLFVYHCANHANFIDPIFFVEENGDIIPYSISKTQYICSCCLEVYDIIGWNFKRKFVVPCPGAVIFAGLKKDKYYEVKKVEGD